MTAELSFLHLLLIFAFGLAPLVTKTFFVGPSTLHHLMHALAFLLTSSGLLLNQPLLTFAWPLFCALSFGLFLSRRRRHFPSWVELAKCVPFLFSIIATVWLVSGANGFGLLGYGKTFSFYASLHSHFLGWITLAVVAKLASQDLPYRKFFIASVFVCFASFLLVAFGIDGVPFIKPVGVFGITIMVGGSLLFYLLGLDKSHRTSLLLGILSFAIFIGTMSLAWANEFALPGERQLEFPASDN